MQALPDDDKPITCAWLTAQGWLSDFSFTDFWVGEEEMKNRGSAVVHRRFSDESPTSEWFMSIFSKEGWHTHGRVKTRGTLRLQCAALGVWPSTVQIGACRV